MKLLRKSLLLTVVFGGYLFLSMPSTTDGFIVYVHPDTNRLIDKIDEPQWRIGYNFVHGCAEQFRHKEDKLKEEMTKSLRVWIQPLRELYPNKVFTDDFVFVRLPDVDECFANKDALRQVNVRITFDCKRKPGTGGMAEISRVFPPEVCTLNGTDINHNFIFTLVHELGHAFGMGDTYVRDRHVSTGGLASTQGKQPSSIMSGLSRADPPRPMPFLQEDDRNGIIWLYKYLYEGHPAGDCFFRDYVSAGNGKGNCEPRHPLIFEAQHGLSGTVSLILQDDPALELNAFDSGGNTALHYAVQRWNRKMVETLLKQKGLRVNMLNKQRLNPAQLARRLNRVGLAKLIEEHPTAKYRPIAWDVTPREKLATVWGRLKRRN